MDKKKTMHRVAAAVTAGMLVGEASTAHAAKTFVDLGSNIISSSGALPQMISTVAYVGGVGLGVAGVFKLKQHVDNPGQTPMKDGLVRLGAGGGLLALPFVTSAMVGSINNNDASVASAVHMDAPELGGAPG
jgi:hypothetical protein